MNKITLSAIASVSVAVIAGASWYGYSTYQAGANPDYICTARIVNPTCVATSYSPWVNGTRTAYGTKQVSLTYSSSRVTCDGSYVPEAATVYKAISGQITDLVQTVDTEKSEVSQQYNLQYSTEACSFIETAPAVPTSTSTTTNPTGGTGGIVDSTVEVDTGSTTGSGN